MHHIAIQKPSETSHDASLTAGPARTKARLAGTRTQRYTPAYQSRTRRDCVVEANEDQQRGVNRESSLAPENPEVDSQLRIRHQNYRERRRRLPRNTNAGLDQPRLTVALVANLETHRVVGSPAAVAAQLGVAPWHELGCDAGADGSAAEALADRVTRAGQQAPGAAALVTEQAPVPALGSLPSRTKLRQRRRPSTVTAAGLLLLVQPSTLDRTRRGACNASNAKSNGRNRRLLVRMLERAPRRSRQLSAPPSSRATR